MDKPRPAATAKIQGSDVSKARIEGVATTCTLPAEAKKDGGGCHPLADDA